MESCWNSALCYQVFPVLGNYYVYTYFLYIYTPYFSIYTPPQIRLASAVARLPDRNLAYLVYMLFASLVNGVVLPQQRRSMNMGYDPDT